MQPLCTYWRHCPQVSGSSLCRARPLASSLSSAEPAAPAGAKNARSAKASGCCPCEGWLCPAWTLRTWNQLLLSQPVPNAFLRWCLSCSFEPLGDSKSRLLLWPSGSLALVALVSSKKQLFSQREETWCVPGGVNSVLCLLQKALAGDQIVWIKG